MKSPDKRPEWAGEVIYLAHKYDFTLQELAAEAEYNKEYVNNILHGTSGLRGCRAIFCW